MLITCPFLLPVVRCYNLNMFDIQSDTHPEISAVQMELLKQASSARKLALLGQMNQTVQALAKSGLQSRHPQDTPAMLRRRMADLLLGSELASRVYGPPADQG